MIGALHSGARRPTKWPISRLSRNPWRGRRFACAESKQALRIEPGSFAPVDFSVESEPFDFLGAAEELGRHSAFDRSFHAGMLEIFAASAAVSVPVENSRPLSIDSQPLKIQLTTKTMQPSPSR